MFDDRKRRLYFLSKLGKNCIFVSDGLVGLFQDGRRWRD